MDSPEVRKKDAFSDTSLSLFRCYLNLLSAAEAGKRVITHANEINLFYLSAPALTLRLNALKRRVIRGQTRAEQRL